MRAIKGCLGTRCEAGVPREEGDKAIGRESIGWTGEYISLNLGLKYSNEIFRKERRRVNDFYNLTDAHHTSKLIQRNTETELVRSLRPIHLHTFTQMYRTYPNQLGQVRPFFVDYPATDANSRIILVRESF